MKALDSLSLTLLCHVHCMDRESYGDSHRAKSFCDMPGLYSYLAVGDLLTVPCGLQVISA